MEEVTYSEIADYFISFYYQKGDNITNFRLHKLLYYAQVKSLALYNKRLFNEDFFAWKHGPALPALHRDYNNGHWSPVSKEQSQHYIQAFEKKIKDHQLLLLKEVLARYDWTRAAADTLNVIRGAQ